MKYKTANLRVLTPGLRYIRYTISYFGWRRPNYWCSRLIQPTTVPITTTPTTVPETTTPTTVPETTTTV
jgi:hypothetical protein